jgi:hypothetical protein
VCLDYLLQINTDCERDQLVNIFKQGRQQFADAFAVSEYQKDAFIRDNKNVFFKWLLSKNQKIVMMMRKIARYSKTPRKPLRTLARLPLSTAKYMSHMFGLRWVNSCG